MFYFETFHTYRKVKRAVHWIHTNPHLYSPSTDYHFFRLFIHPSIHSAWCWRLNWRPRASAGCATDELHANPDFHFATFAFLKFFSRNFLFTLSGQKINIESYNMWNFCCFFFFKLGLLFMACSFCNKY